MADEVCMPTRRKRKTKLGKKLSNNPPKTKRSKISDNDWKAIGVEDELLSSGGNEFFGLEELKSYNEEDLQAFISAESATKRKKKSKAKKTDDVSENEDEEDSKVQTNDKKHNEIIERGSNDEKDQLIQKSTTQKDPADNSVGDITKKLTQKERKRIQRKEYRLNKLKVKQKQWRLQNKEEKKRKKEQHQTDEGEHQKQEESNLFVEKEDTPLLNDEKESEQAGVKDLHKDLSEWTGLGVPNEILKSLAKLNFLTPTEIQKECLPHAILNHKDVLGAAETGT